MPMPGLVAPTGELGTSELGNRDTRSQRWLWLSGSSSTSSRHLDKSRYCVPETGVRDQLDARQCPAPQRTGGASPWGLCSPPLWHLAPGFLRRDLGCWDSLPVAAALETRGKAS